MRGNIRVLPTPSPTISFGRYLAFSLEAPTVLGYQISLMKRPLSLLVASRSRGKRNSQEDRNLCFPNYVYSAISGIVFLAYIFWSKEK